MPQNIMPSHWVTFDPRELRVMLTTHGLFPGQLNLQGAFALPVAGETCRLLLTYDGAAISRIDKGPAFNADEWERIVAEVERAIAEPATKIARGWGFSTWRVTGSWHGVRSGVQILPAPAGSPSCSVVIGDHPFVLEVPLKHHSDGQVVHYRRAREVRDMLLLLNLLLVGHIKYELQRSSHAWAVSMDDDRIVQSAWAQLSYFGPLGDVVVNAISPPAQHLIDVAPVPDYYTQRGAGDDLRVPANLDDMIVRYLGLPPVARARFGRALYWFDMASRLWDISASNSFAALVSSIEALTERPPAHSTTCNVCGDSINHEKPGATARFRTFLETHAGSADLSPSRTRMYDLRSRILHGNSLLQLDHISTMGWDPPWFNERELHDGLWTVVRTALRDWLAAQR